MVMPILAAVLGAVMLLGGLIPNIGTHIVNSQLRQVVQNARRLETRITQVPSYGLLSGAVERLEITAEEFQVQGMGVESFWLAITPIKMNGGKMLGGQIELEKPTQAEARLVITQQALNDFMASERIQKALHSIRVEIPGVPNLGEDALAVEEPHIELKPGRVTFSATIQALGGFVVIPLSASTGFQLTSEDTLVLENVEAVVSGNPVPPDIFQSILGNLNPILDLRKFSNEDLTLHFRQLEVQDGRLILAAAADMRKIPEFAK